MGLEQPKQGEGRTKVELRNPLTGGKNPRLDRLIEKGPDQIRQTAEYYGRKMALGEMSAEEAKQKVLDDVTTYFNTIEARIQN